MLTQERVQHLFTYDKKNGLLIRKFGTGTAKGGKASLSKDKDGYSRARQAAAAWLRCQLVDVCGSSVPSLLPSKARRGSELPLAMFQISRKYRQIPR